MSRKRSPADRQAQLKAACDRLQIPAVVAVQLLAGTLKEADLAGHPDRAKWQAEWQDEVTLRGTDAKSLRRRQAEQIAGAFDVPGE